MRDQTFLRAFACVLLAAVSFPAAGESPTVTEIRFEGNRVTEEAVMRREMAVAEGDPADPKRIERSRQAIMDLGLFKSVSAELVRAEPGLVLVFTVVEKRYVLPLPKVDADPNGDYSYGGELRFANLFGLNQRLELDYESVRSVYGDQELRREIEAVYDYPRIDGTPYSLKVSAKLVRTEFDTSQTAGDGRYRLGSRKLNFGFSRWLQRAGPASGWRTGAGMSMEQRKFTHLSGVPGPFEDDRAVDVSGSVGFFDVHDLGVARQGYEYGITSVVGLRVLGSDEHYSRNLYFHRRYRHYPRGINLNTQFRLGFANGTRFGSPAYSLGSDKSLRGYDSNVVKGNALLLLNVEYLRALARGGGLRGVLFADVGNVYPRALDIDVTDLRAAVGIGLRWQLQSFVNVTLRVDAAYGFGGETVIYANTSRSF